MKHKSDLVVVQLQKMELQFKIILANLSSANFDVKKGDRIAQMVISQYEQAWFEDVKSLDDTDRGSGGFGSTGIE